MAAGNALGAAVGARVALHGGDRFVRAIVLLVVLALVTKLSWDLVHRCVIRKEAWTARISSSR